MMKFVQLMCIQLLLLIISHQVLTRPTDMDSSDALTNTNRNFRPYIYGYANFDDILGDDEGYENFRQHLLSKVSKRRAKANLAGLWGVPTKFA
ncbi:hypothetical protein I4U23_009914 [Adineta vaga]|nr:hypothetical protein I4U23_009914 [Adineta vaga]